MGIDICMIFNKVDVKLTANGEIEIYRCSSHPLKAIEWIWQW